MKPGTTSTILDEDGVNLRAIREELQLSQAKLARMLGVSVRTVQSCEQGWRHPGAAVEKSALLLLVAHRKGGTIPGLRCWEVMNCSSDKRRKCLAFRSGQGHLCWYLSGLLCPGPDSTAWEKKRSLCLNCELFKLMLGQPEREERS
jgi:DNA-binding XRE family transcriptional regulator